MWVLHCTNTPIHSIGNFFCLKNPLRVGMELYNKNRNREKITNMAEKRQKEDYRISVQLTIKCMHGTNVG